MWGGRPILEGAFQIIRVRSTAFCRAVALSLHTLSIVLASLSMADARHSKGKDTTAPVIASRVVCGEAIPNCPSGDCFGAQRQGASQ